MVRFEGFDRRAFLSSTATVLSIGLAGCSSESDNSDVGTESTPTTSPTPTATPTPSPTASQTPTATPRQKQVDMVKLDDCQAECYRFRPETVQIQVGMKVKWVNQGRQAHTVTAYEDRIPEEAEYFASGGFESEQAARDAYWNEKKGIVEKGEPYAHVFEVPGEYHYFSIPREEPDLGPMLGMVEVL